MKAIDVCAGAGGLSLGLTRAGFDVLGVELDDVAADVHRRHVGPCETADITTWSPSERVDLVAGGVPCQSFSSSGKRQGTFDPRGALFVHLVRIATEARARAVVLENVVGLVNWRGGQALRQIVDAFREAGFAHVQHCVLDAADYGVAQHRRRVFVVGFCSQPKFVWPTPTHGPSLWASAPWVSVREALGLGGAYRRGRRPGKHYAGMRALDVEEPSVTVAASFRPEFLDRVDTPAPTICSSSWHNITPSTRPSQRPFAELGAAMEAIGYRPSTTVSADSRIAPAGHHDRQQRGAVRLTEEQCAALQDFPPGWDWPKTKRDAHRLIGNAVPPKLGEVVGRAVREALESADAQVVERAEEPVPVDEPVDAVDAALEPGR